MRKESEDDEWKTWRQSYITTAAAPSSITVSKQENDKRKEKAVESTKDERLPTDALEETRQWIISNSKNGVLNGRRLGTLLLRLLCEQEEVMDRRKQVSKPWTIARPTPAAAAAAAAAASSTATTMAIATANSPSSSFASSAATVNCNPKHPLQHQMQSESDGKETPSDLEDTPEESKELSESQSMLRQIEWHVVLLLELWIHHRERVVQELYPLLLVLQHGRHVAQKKEKKEKRQWKRRNKPSNMNSDKTPSKKAPKKKPKKTKHGKEESSSKFSACAYIQKQLGKCQTVVAQTPSLVNKLQTATPQDKELQLLNHLAAILSQAAFFLSAAQSMTAFLTEKCLTLRIWKALPQVIAHVYDDLERSNPYLEHPPEDPFATVNILTTTIKKKKKKKQKQKQNSKIKSIEQPEKNEGPSRPKLLPQKRNRRQAGGHFHHRSRAAQSTMSEVLKHLSPVRQKFSMSRTDGNSSKDMVRNQKTPTSVPGGGGGGGGGKNNRYLSQNSSQLVTPHGGSKSTKKAAAVDSRKKPKLSLSTTKTNMMIPPSTATNSSRTPAAVVTTTKTKNRHKLQLEPSKSIRPDSEFQPPAQMSPQKSIQSPDCNNKLTRRYTTGTIAATKEKDTMERSRSVGLFPLSPIPTNRASISENTAMMQTPTRKRRPEALLTPIRNKKLPSLKITIDGHENEKNHGNRPLAPMMLTPQRYCQARVAETPDSKSLPTPKRGYHTPVRRHHLSSNNAVVAETPDPSVAKQQQKVRSNENMNIVAETPQHPSWTTPKEERTAAETPQQLSKTVAETPEPVNDDAAKVASIDSIDWEEAASRQGSNSTSIIEPLQLFGGVATQEPEQKKKTKKKKKKPRRVYSLGGGTTKQASTAQQLKRKTDKDETVLQDRRHVTHAVLSQARAFMRRKSFEK
ncbi:MAG: hypothetical protein SGBAC_002912 [Bacillariaceae sp.]